MRTVLDRLSMTITPGQHIGVLGRNGSGKSTLIRLISGAEQPDSGNILRGMSVSWPLAFHGGFQGSLTGYDNVRFICRIYNVAVETHMTYVEAFSELGKYIYEPVKHYSTGMRARLAFALSMIIDFDCYLIDEIIAVGDSRFHAKCEMELFANRRHKAMLLVSHDVNFLRSHCDMLAVLADGRLHTFADFEQGVAFYSRSQSLS
jgi:capsular polysaccharide transport system ATP-binding protein